MATSPAMANQILEKKESEKQISVDPISLLPSSPPNMPLAKTTSSLIKHKQEPVSHWALSRQHSVALSNLERLRESHMRRSKSCGEGRACQPSLDFDLWSTKNHQQMTDYQNKQQGEETSKKGESDKFKCGACLFLPSFGKGKAVRARKEVERDIIVSHRVSLEKFECGSWRSEDGDNTTTFNLFFDLPVELMRCSSVNDTESPVTAGFVFDNKDNHHNHKGVLKVATATTSIGRKSHESCNSSRHVRFSTSSSPTLCPASPTSPCITPHIRRARDDFTAFLEAQSA